jgi:hypothetical protein
VQYVYFDIEHVYQNLSVTSGKETGPCHSGPQGGSRFHRERLQPSRYPIEIVPNNWPTVPNSEMAECAPVLSKSASSNFKQV